MEALFESHHFENHLSLVFDSISMIVKTFEADSLICFKVMLVSLRAGGVGLNLIGGSHLFLLDQHW